MFVSLVLIRKNVFERNRGSVNKMAFYIKKGKLICKIKKAGDIKKCKSAYNKLKKKKKK